MKKYRPQLHRDRLPAMLIRVAFYTIGFAILTFTGTSEWIALITIAVIAFGVGLTTEEVVTWRR